MDQAFPLFHIWWSSASDCWKEVIVWLEEGKFRFLKSAIGWFGRSEATLLVSMVFGGDLSNFPKLEHSFKIIGMQHVTSASGYNVSLVLGMVSRVISRFWPGWARWLFLCLVLLLYIRLAGTTASLWRAGSMAGLALSATHVWRRQYHPLYALAQTVAVLWLTQPTVVTSIGFQLSVAATVGIMYFAPLGSDPAKFELHLQAVSSPPPAIGWSTLTQQLRTDLVVTVAAQLLTAPLILWYFQEFSLLSFVSNPLLLWLTPWLTMATATMFGIYLVGGGGVFSTFAFLHGPLGWVVNAFLTAVTALGEFEAGFWRFNQVPAWWMFIAYLVTIWCCGFYLKKRQYEIRQRSYLIPISIK